MLTNLLDKLPQGGRYVGFGEVSLYALIGAMVVFAGITFLIFIVWLVGKMLEGGAKNTKAKQEPAAIENMKNSVTPNSSSAAEDIDEETVAVIMAALTAYYEKNNPKCEFTLKKIKRIRRDDYA